MSHTATAKRQLTPATRSTSTAQPQDIARALIEDRDALNPVRRYLVARQGLSLAGAGEAEDAFLQFMADVANATEPIGPSPVADVYWHATILHTQLYEGWCKRHFGRFIHHVPTDPDEMCRQRSKASFGANHICQHNCTQCRACQPGDS